jgi:hypothetical protein
LQKIGGKKEYGKSARNFAYLSVLNGKNIYEQQKYICHSKRLVWQVSHTFFFFCLCKTRFKLKWRKSARNMQNLAVLNGNSIFVAQK